MKHLTIILFFSLSLLLNCGFKPDDSSLESMNENQIENQNNDKWKKIVNDLN